MFRKQVSNIDDYNNLTEDEKVDYIVIGELRRIIREEYEKAEHEQNADLINECYDALYEKTGIRINYSDEEIKRNVEKAMERADVIKAQKAKHTKRLSRFRLKACIAVIMLLATQFVAMVFGYNPIMEIYELLRSHESTGTLTEEGITYTYSGEAILYATIDELLKQEELTILYPTRLPDGLEIIEIHDYYLNEYRQITIIFNNEDLLFQINEYHYVDVNNLFDYELLNINEVDVYVLNRNNVYEAIFHHNGYEYTIMSPKYNLLIEIIKNIGE